ncbi:MAG: hypothetical protein IJQ01_01660 [Selenomonadaceae bacterium]|nr:hypothetical protein [Selenomonadaceae bacterium]
MFWQLDEDGNAYRETETVKERIYITERYDVCLVSCIVGKDGRTIEKFNTQTLESGIAGKTNAEFAIRKHAETFNCFLKGRNHEEKVHYNSI